MTAQIARPIGAADMEHYESLLVIRMALQLSGKTMEGWETTSYRSKQRWLNKSVKVLCGFLNDADVVARLPLTLKTLVSRI